MQAFWSYLTVLLALVHASDAFEFVSSAQDCRDAGMWCVPLSHCRRYKTRANLRRDRPMVCGFQRGEARVCCAEVGAGRRSLAGQSRDSEEPLGRSAAPAKRRPGPGSPHKRRPRPAPAALSASKSSEAPRMPTEFASRKPAESNVGGLGPKRTSMPAALPSNQLSLPDMCGRVGVPSKADSSLNADNSGMFAEHAFAVPLPPVNPNILGGEDVGLITRAVDGATGHRWPWIVLLGRWTDVRLGDWFCGGTLITDQHVLTAAHCFRSALPGTVGVRIGDHDLGLSDEANHQERNITSVVLHPEFRHAQNDLAVVRLASPVERSFSVEPICLPSAGAEHVGRDVEAAGWGMLEFDGDLSDILQQVPLRVVEPAACEAAFRRLRTFDALFPDGLLGSRLCAGSRDEERRDACAGDSGGPLTARREDGSFELVGVISTGVGCGTEFPGLYTKVSAFTSWIVSNLT